MKRLIRLMYFLLFIVIALNTILLGLTNVYYIPKESYEETTIELTEYTIVEEDPLYYTVTEEERDLLAKLVYAEASICSVECQTAVVSVIFNRLESGHWRQDMNNDGRISLYDIIYYPEAFSPITRGGIDKFNPTEKEYEAVDLVLKNGPILPTYVRYFRNNRHFTNNDFRAGYTGYTDIDNVYFGYFTEWEKGVW